MGLFKSSKKVSSKNIEKPAAAPAPPPVEAEPVAPVETPQAVPEPAPVETFGYLSTPLVHTVSDSSFIEYQPRPPPNGKGFVSPLSSWLEEYGTGPFLSRDGTKPQYPGKDKKDDEDVKEEKPKERRGRDGRAREDKEEKDAKTREEKEEKDGKDAESSSSGDAPADKDVEFTPRKKSSPSKSKGSRDPAESSEFTRVKRGSARSSRREEPYEYDRVRSSRDGRRERAEGRSADRDSRTMSRTSDVSDRSFGSDNSGDKMVKDREDKVVRERDDKVVREREDKVVKEREEKVVKEREEKVVKDREGRQSTRSRNKERVKEEEVLAPEEEKVGSDIVDEQPAVDGEDKDSKDSVDDGEDKEAKVTQLKPAQTLDESESPRAKGSEEDLLKDDVEVAQEEAEDADAVPEKVKEDLDLDDEVDGKKMRTLDNGSDPADVENYTSDDKELPDKDSEMVLLKDKLKQLQQKLAEERADKLELQKKLKDRDREIFSLNKQLDKVEAQLDRYERFGVGIDGSHSGSRASLVDQDGNPMTDRDMKSADDLQLALRAFKEHSNAKLAETFKQNADLRHQVESYETLCRTIGEVLRDYEWLQQCRIVTGDLDYSRLRKAMMKLWHTGKTRAVLPVIAMVLAFGPDEVSRCRHVLNSAKQDADMVDYIPEIIEHNMDETMKRDAITVYIEAHKQLTEDTEIALYLTDRFAERYKGEWHCVVGEQYALSSCYESKVIKFKSGHRSVILWSN